MHGLGLTEAGALSNHDATQGPFAFGGARPQIETMSPIIYHPAYDAPMPLGHRFPMGKFAALAKMIEAEGLIGPQGFHRPELASAAQLGLAHDPAYVEAVLTAKVDPAVARRIGLPITAEVAKRAQAATGGTILTARLALTEAVACNTAGGSHHANDHEGAGFCVFNDVAVAAHVLLAEGLVKQILVVDLDVHQGDGTARLFEHDPRVFTFSMHAAKNFPAQKAVSDLDVELEDGIEDEDYLARLDDILPNLIRRVRPDLVFYIAGVDPHRNDRLGRLNLSDQGLAARETYVLETVLSRGIPLAGVLGGGYDTDVERLAGRHIWLHRAAAQAHARWR
jgi:acetoin utilization deacetylase AcuC-like enzyme